MVGLPVSRLTTRSLSTGTDAPEARPVVLRACLNQPQSAMFGIFPMLGKLVHETSPFAWTMEAEVTL